MIMRTLAAGSDQASCSLMNQRRWVRKACAGQFDGRRSESSIGFRGKTVLDVSSEHQQLYRFYVAAKRKKVYAVDVGTDQLRELTAINR